MTTRNSRKYITCLFTTNVAIVATIQGGAHISRVMVSLKPIVLTNVGKYALKLNEMNMDMSERVIHQTFQSVNAMIRLSLLLIPLASSSPTPTSSSSRFSTKWRSKGLSHFDVAGKSGSINMAQIATKTVREPSI